MQHKRWPPRRQVFRFTYVVAVPKNSKVHATSNKGDTIGYEGEDALPDLPALVVGGGDEQQCDGELRTHGGVLRGVRGGE